MFGKKSPNKKGSRGKGKPPLNAADAKANEPELPKHEKPSPPGDAENLKQQLSELYREMAPQLFRYGVLLTRNPSIAQDAVQETFLKYYVQRQQGEVQAERAWLFRVLRNYVLDQQKSLGTKLSVGLEEARSYPDKGYSPEKVFAQSEAMKLALQVLSPRELQCLQLRTEGFTYKEIAEILDIEPGTVGALLARSSDKIRKAFGEERLPCEAL